MVTKNELIKIAKECLDSGLSVMAMTKKKPVCEWKIFQEIKATYDEIDQEFKKYNATHLGVFGGYGNLEIIDVDVDHDPTKLIVKQYYKLLKCHLPETYKRLVIDQSAGGGMHIYYRCSNSGRNNKLARIPGLNKKGKMANQELICTKGKGGYVIIAPSAGYRTVQGSLLDVPWIEPEERDLMISLAKSFDLTPIKQKGSGK